MIEFKILKKSKKSRARLGVIKTPHGDIETPAFVPVATQAVIKTLDSGEVIEAGCQLAISNTFHLHLKPGESYIRRAGGLHKFADWRLPLMTDSGGFQVFSLGFGMDFNSGKVADISARREDIIKHNSQPKSLKITPDGVHFRSPLDERELFLGPRESIKIQEKLGADIIYAFDECTSPYANYDYSRASMERTHSWANICIKSKKSDQAMFGIVQGSHFKDLREESANIINSLGFDGFGIGGDLGEGIKDMKRVLGWTIPYLADEKPRHMLGIGYLENMETIIKEGIDTFDCIVPTHYGRRGVAFTSSGKLNLRQSKFLSDKKPLDHKCKCFVCINYGRNYISHLFRAKEITDMKFLSFHNLHYFNKYVADIRNEIKNGKI